MNYGTRRALLSNPSSAIKYLLYDTFATALAAGSVNGTASEPGSNALANAAPVRTVVDTGNKLSVSGGVASFALGGSGGGNPGLWYSSISRALGRLLIVQLNWSSLAQSSGFEFGFENAQSGQPSTDTFYQTLASLRAYENAVPVAVTTLTTATNYSLCIILRTAGAWHFIKGGAFTNWTLVWMGNTNATATLYPALADYATPLTAKNIRIPQPLYIPLPLCFDGFTRANGALGSSESVGPDAQSIAALAWAFTAGVWTVASNAATSAPNLGSDVVVNGTFAADANWTKGAGWTIAAGVASATSSASGATLSETVLTVGVWYQTVWTLLNWSAGQFSISSIGNGSVIHGANGTFTETVLAGSTLFAIRTHGTSSGDIDNVSCKVLTLADLFASVTVSTPDMIADVAIHAWNTGTQAGLVLNLDSAATPANFVVAYFTTLSGNVTCRLDKCVAGVYTNLISVGRGFVADAVLRVVKSGNNYSLFYANAAVGAVQVISDAGIVSNKMHGMFNTYSGNTLDAFTLWPVGTSNEYSTLDLY